jgi:acetyltransferase-like isoleucine patch superfamily enzyme
VLGATSVSDDIQLDAERFTALLRASYEAEDARLRREFQRSLPFQDAAFDRWERARRLGFGDGSSIYNSALVYGDVRVGRQVWIGPNTLLDGSGKGGLVIGDFCSVAVGVHIYTHDTVLAALSGRQLPRSEAAVRIGNCVYIGPQTIIAAGVTIGNRCVIAANSFVNRDVSDGTVVGGSPARRLGSVVGEGRDVQIVFDHKSH